MSKIEDITPHEKFETFEKRRGKFEPHEDIRARSLQQRQLMGIIAAVTVVILVAIWFFLAQRGTLFGKTSSDSQFVQSLTNTLSSNQSINSSFDTNASQNVTPEEKKVLDETDKQLFPEFQ